ncbi:hypothetical protein [Desulfovibrio sp.]|nr:hypothetical protein [Desulfovibrio sp.]
MRALPVRAVAAIIGEGLVDQQVAMKRPSHLLLSRIQDEQARPPRPGEV